MEVKTEEIQSIQKTENTVSTIYTVEVSNSEGKESVSIGVDKETQVSHLIDYKIDKVETVVEVSESEVVVEMKTGVKVLKTTDKTTIEENKYVKKVMEKVGITSGVETQ